MASFLTKLLKEVVEELIKAIFALFDHWINNHSVSTKINQTVIVTLVYFAYNCVNNPEGAINTFMIMLIDMVYGFFPVTPNHYTIGYMLTEFSSQFPSIGWGVIYQIFYGMSVMFGLWCVVKLWQLLPFT